jgi:hypothetical protein
MLTEERTAASDSCCTWIVKPPLESISEETQEQIVTEMRKWN